MIRAGKSLGALIAAGAIALIIAGPTWGATGPPTLSTDHGVPGQRVGVTDVLVAAYCPASSFSAWLLGGEKDARAKVIQGSVKVEPTGGELTSAVSAFTFSVPTVEPGRYAFVVVCGTQKPTSDAVAGSMATFDVLALPPTSASTDSSPASGPGLPLLALVIAGLALLLAIALPRRAGAESEKARTRVSSR